MPKYFLGPLPFFSSSSLTHSMGIREKIECCAFACSSVRWKPLLEVLYDHSIFITLYTPKGMNFPHASETGIGTTPGRVSFFFTALNNFTLDEFILNKLLNRTLVLFFEKNHNCQNEARNSNDKVFRS